MIPVQDLMTTVKSQAQANDPLAEVIAIMQRNNHSSVVVTNGGRVSGIVTERDLVGCLARLLAGEDIAALAVSAFMSNKPVCVLASSSLSDAINLTRSHNVRHLPVVNNAGMLVGMVTQTDMINVYVSILEERAQLIHANTELRAQSREDPLLQIGNRRAMEADLLKVAAVAERTAQTHSIALFDIDYFKLFNDRYGHMAGDRALQAVVAAIKQTMRHGDSLYRYGGEELLLLMPNSDLTGARFAAVRALKAVAAIELPHIDSPYKVLTISGGLASSEQLTHEQLIAQADKALYRAKANGRNCLSEALILDAAEEEA